MIVIDPRFTETAAKADLWLPLRPGSDSALALAWLNVIIWEGLYDQTFIENCCIGFEELAQHVQPYTPEWAVPLTWLEAEQIRQGARIYMARYAVVLDARRCIGCQSCTVACRVNNALPVDMIYNPVTTVGPVGVFPDVHLTYLPLLCMHCANPPCMDCCPTGASQQRKDGIVWVDEHKCVGCKACVMACPYGARIPNHEKGVVQKCDFCMERVASGKEPYCVKTCHQRARIFGDLEDKTSQVYKLVNREHVVRLLPELGTEPYAFYIME